MQPNFELRQYLSITFFFLKGQEVLMTVVK